MRTKNDTIMTVTGQGLGLMVLALVMMTGCRAVVDPDTYVVRAHQELVPPSSDRAHVVFLCPEEWYSWFNAPVYQDEVLAGALRPETYFVLQVWPGRHEFATNLFIFESNIETVTLQVQGGKTYYLLFTPPITARRPKLELIGEEVALAYLPTLKEVRMIERPREAGFPFVLDSREEQDVQSVHNHPAAQ